MTTDSSMSASENGHTGGYTPGPWKYYADLPSTDPNWNIVTTENGLRVLANIHIEPGNGMDEANARLIAAAPELLEALKKAKETIRAWHGPNAWEIYDRSSPEMQAINAAISKAEGGAA